MIGNLIFLLIAENKISNISSNSVYAYLILLPMHSVNPNYTKIFCYEFLISKSSISYFPILEFDEDLKNYKYQGL